MNTTSIENGARPSRSRTGQVVVLQMCVFMCVFIASLVLDLRVASADPAREHFLEGRKLLKQGKAKAACEAFQKSLDIARTNVGVFLNLGDCNQKQAKFASAVAAFTEASRLAAEKGDTKRQVLAEQRLAVVASRLSTVKVLMPSELANRDEVAVLLDEALVAGTALIAPIPVDIGDHTLVVRVGDDAYFTKPFVVSAEKETLVIEVPSRANTASDDESLKGNESTNSKVDETPDHATKALGELKTPEVESSGASPIVWSLLGVAVVSAGAGTYFGLDARSKWKEADSCNATQCTQADADLAASARLRGHISTGLFVLSAASLGVGAWLYFLNDSSGEHEGVGVVVGPTSVGVVGRF